MSLALKRLPSEAVEMDITPRHPGLEEAMRVAEALLFAATEPLKSEDLAARLPASTDIEAVLEGVASLYAGRGINLVRVAGGWAFRTAPDLAYVLAGAAPEPQKLSRAALETLAIIAYHQPTTRAEIEEIRGVSISKGTLDTLLETGWIRLRGRRRSPGRPLTYGTTPAFLAHFGLDAIGDLPGLDELKGLGFLEGRLPPELTIPMPNDDVLREDEDPLDEADLSLGPRADETD
jgi:segregation and condensation protein B